MFSRVILLALCFFSLSSCGVWANDPTDHTMQFYVLQEAWHTGIVVEARSIPDSLLPLAKLRRSYKYIEIGWGDEVFYQSNTINSGIVLKAVILPSQSVLRVYGLWMHPEEFYGPETTLYKIKCTPEQYAQLLSYISASFMTCPEGNAILSEYKDQNRSFYLAHCNYHLFRTCNTWVARALRESAYRVRHRGVLTRGQLARQLRRISAEKL